MRFHVRRHGPLTAEQRENVSSQTFVFPETREYPIDTANRARNALARVSQHGTPEQKRAVCIAVHEHYPEIHEKHCGLHG